MLRTMPPDDLPMVAGHNTQTIEAPINQIVTRRSLAAIEGDILSDSSDDEEASVHSDVDDRPGNPLDEASVSSDDDDSVVVENLAAENEQQANDQQANDNGSAEDDNNQKTLLEVLRSLEFKYQERESTVGYNWVGTEQRQKSMYLGGEGLRPGIWQTFSTPFECFQRCGGMTNQMVSNLTSSTNAYYHSHLKLRHASRNGYYHSQRWKDVTIQEMYRFLGILLKMSLNPVDGGGYTAYFQTTNVTYNLGPDVPPVEIEDSRGFAVKYMTLNRFRQIRGAFHPENKVAAAGGGDKCYQFRTLLNQLNETSRKTFFVPKDMAFDEGGVGCRSRMCPVRQFNKDKPQRFRVDFFIMASSSSYAILHLDVYQGANATNSYIRPSIHRFPTTMKAVLNVCYGLGLNKETQGMHHISMDNGIWPHNLRSFFENGSIVSLLQRFVPIDSDGTSR